MSLLKTLFSFFNKRDLRFSFFLMTLMLATAFIELAGIGSLFPYIKVLGQPSYIHSNATLNSIYQFFGFNDNNQFLIFVGLAIFAMILLKAVLAIVNNYFQAKMTFGINNRISKFCLKSFMDMPYAKAIDQNSSVLSKHLLVDVAGVATVLQAVLTMVTDVVISLALVVLMLWVDPGLVASVVLGLGVLLYFVNRFTKRRINNLSVANEYCNRHAYKTANESLSGLRDVKAYHVENYFLRRYLKWQYQLSDQLIEFSVVSNVPTNVLNVMGFGTLLIILLYLMVTHGNLIAILPTIGLIAVSVQRLLPSASRISTNIANIRRYKPLVYVVRKAIDSLSESGQKESTESASNKLPFNQSLTLKDISYSYPGSNKLALENISCCIEKNSAFGIVGESGAGKTTLVDVLLGLLQVDAGELLVDAKSITANATSSLSELVGYVPQQVFLLDGSIRENIAFGIPENEIDEAALSQAIEIAQLTSLIDQLPEGVNTQIGEKGAKISGGQRQRIGIARALYRDPEILIMDEATNALDAATEKEFNNALKVLMKEKTLIIIAHRLSSVEICQHIIQLDQGRIVAEGEYQDLVKNSESFRRIYNLNEEPTNA